MHNLHKNFKYKNPVPNYNCELPTHRAKVVGDHGLLEEEYNAAIASFFGLTIPASLPCPLKTITDILDIGNCWQSKIMVYAGVIADQEDPGNPISNEDIGITPIGLVATKAGIAPTYSREEFDAFSNYSHALFKGVIELYGPDRFSFSKARRNGKITFVFKAFLSTDPKVVYFGDLSDIEP